MLLQQFLKNGSPWERTHVGELLKDCILWEGPHGGASEKRKEGVAETKVYEPTTTPHLGGEGSRVKNEGERLSLGIRSGKDDFLSILLYVFNWE